MCTLYMGTYAHTFNHKNNLRTRIRAKAGKQTKKNPMCINDKKIQGKKNEILNDSIELAFVFFEFDCIDYEYYKQSCVFLLSLLFHFKS